MKRALLLFLHILSALCLSAQLPARLIIIWPTDADAAACTEHAYLLDEARRQFPDAVVSERTLLPSADDTQPASIDATLSELHQDGVDHVILLPTWLGNASLSSQLQQQADRQAHRFGRLTIVPSLLAQPDDARQAIAIVGQQTGLKQAVVIATESEPTASTDDAALLLQSVLRHLPDYKQWYALSLGTYPNADDELPLLRAQKVKRPILFPLSILPPSDTSASALEQLNSQCHAAGIQSSVAEPTAATRQALIRLLLSRARIAATQSRATAEESRFSQAAARRLEHRL